MIPIFVLLVAFIVFRAAGFAGVHFFADEFTCLRFALAAMFFLTASAHWGRRKPDLIRMVPPAFRFPELLVAITGILEILGAVGLIFRPTSRISAICLAVLLVAMFPANVRATREKLTIGGRPVPALRIRLPLQLIFLACLIAVAWR
jgi:uncharacterized membrane protein